jgi:hypothetical protein
MVLADLQRLQNAPSDPLLQGENIAFHVCARIGRVPRPSRSPPGFAVAEVPGQHPERRDQNPSGSLFGRPTDRAKA